MKTIVLTGNNLTRKQVIDIAINNAPVSVKISKKFTDSEKYIRGKAEKEEIVYGVTTGFGSKADTRISKEDAKQLQRNLLLSHASGMGKPFSKEMVRAIMAIRLNTLLIGHSGVRKETVEQLAFLLNNQIHPVIPEQGSVGASGDLCPLSHMALPLIGEGELEYKGKTWATQKFLGSATAKELGFSPIELSYKEGLALNNGTTVMVGVAVIALYHAEKILRNATLTSALNFEALCARSDAFAFAPVHEVRNHSGQTAIAQQLAQLLKGSKNIDIQHNDIVRHIYSTQHIEPEIKLRLQKYALKENKEQVSETIIHELKSKAEAGNNYKAIATVLEFARKKWKPQDAYSIRCIPQVYGASKTAIDHAASVIDNELNAAVDNPLIFTEEDRVVSGGNFHGQPIALVMDYLKLALAEIGNITERQINKLVDGNTNDCLPSYLVNGSGLVSGLMIPQYAAASIVSENKVLVHPASADSIPTGENTEDHVSMGTIAARQAVEIAGNVEKIIAIAAITGFYAVTQRMEQFEKVNMEAAPEKRLSKHTYTFYTRIRNANPLLKNTNFTGTDRFLSPELHAVLNMLRNLE